MAVSFICPDAHSRRGCLHVSTLCVLTLADFDHGVPTTAHLCCCCDRQAAGEVATVGCMHDETCSRVRAVCLLTCVDPS